MGEHKLKLKGYSRLALTIIFTLGFIAVTVLGVLYDGPEFLTVFPVLAVIESSMVKNLFENNDECEK